MQISSSKCESIEMIYKNLLYSRSENRGYRWILLPSFLTQEDGEKLQGLLLSDDFSSSLSPTDPLFSFCLMRTAHAYILARLRKTEYTDNERSGRRPISCIDGIVVENKDAWFLRMAISWILTEYIDCLDSWKVIGFEGSEELHREDPSLRVFQLSALDAMPKIISEPVDFPEVSINNLEFTRAGFSRLVQYLYPNGSESSLDLLQVGFGVSNREICKDFEIIVARTQTKSPSRASRSIPASPKPSGHDTLPQRRSGSDFFTRLYRFLYPNNEE